MSEFPLTDFQYLIAVVTGGEPFSIGRTLKSLSAILLWGAGFFATQVVLGGPEDAVDDPVCMMDAPLMPGQTLTAEQRETIVALRDGVAANPGRLGVLGLQLLELLGALLKLRAGV